MLTKTCKKCNKVKPVDQFINIQFAIGTTGCLDCRNHYRNTYSSRKLSTVSQTIKMSKTSSYYDLLRKHVKIDANLALCLEQDYPLTYRAVTK